MTQTLPATAILSPRRAGQAVGYAVLDLARNEVQPFTRRRVIETGKGRFAVSGGIQAPDAGGYIQWIADGELIIEGEIPPAPTPPDLLQQLTAQLRALLPLFADLVPPVPAPVVNVAQFEAGVDGIRVMVAEQEQRRAEQAAAMGQRVAEIETALSRLAVLDSAAGQVRELTAIRDRISQVLGDSPQAVRIVTEAAPAEFTAELARVREEVAEITRTAEQRNETEETIRRSVVALDRFLESVGRI